MLLSPLEQFRYPIVVAFESFICDLNLSIYILLILQFSTVLFLFTYLRSTGLIPGRLNIVMSELYGIAYKFTQDFLPMVKQKEKNIYPAILTLFLFLIMVNLSGIIPYTTTITTHFFVTGGLAITFGIGMLINNIRIHDVHFLTFFLPHGIPSAISVFLVIIEIVLYIFRPLSLAIRLFANMMAGHALLKIISMALYSVLLKSFTAVFPLKFIYFFMLIGALNFIILLEVLVCIIQAYVFTLLICIYIKDIYVTH